MFRTLLLGIAFVGLCAAASAQNPQVDCPKIMIVEPWEWASPGDNVEFSLSSDLQPQKDVQIEWTVSFGAIESGQGTPRIAVKTKGGVYLESILVKAIVKGLPKECPNTAEGKATVGNIFDRAMLDEWGKLSASDQKGRLDNVLNELVQNPSDVALFILDSEKGSTEKDLLKRVKFIRDHLFRRRKFPVNRIIIASESISYNSHVVRVYRIPARSAGPICRNCRIH